MTNKEFLSVKDNLVCVLADSTYDTYWCCPSVSKDNDTALVANAKTNNECREEVWADVLLGGGTLTIYDYEDDKNHVITLKDMVKGMNKLMKKYPHMYANIKEENYDFYDVDGLMQCVVFGDIIYG